MKNTHEANQEKYYYGFTIKSYIVAATILLVPVLQVYFAIQYKVSYIHIVAKIIYTGLLQLHGIPLHA